MKIKQKLKGFTLVELLIVVIIIGIMAALSWQQLSTAKNYTEAESACDVAASAFNQARNDALTGKTGSTHSVSFSNSTFLNITTSNNETLPFSKVSSSPDVTCKFDIPFGNKNCSGIDKVDITSRVHNNITKTLNISGNIAFCE